MQATASKRKGAARFALVYAPGGVVGATGSTCRMFDTYEEARRAMERHVRETVAARASDGLGPDVAAQGAEEAVAEALARAAVGAWHATGDVGDPGAAEWHIYVEGVPADSELDGVAA